MASTSTKKFEARATALAGLPKGRIGRRKCTPVEANYDVEGRKVIVCKEDLVVKDLPNVKDLGAAVMAETTAAPTGECKRRTKNGRCVGRPRGSSPKNTNYVTKKGKRVDAPNVSFCPADSRQWVDVTVGGGKKARRCRCTAPGNQRYLKNSECK